MANQITINIGAAANDGTGDPLRTAFNDVNLNFANVWNTGLPSSNVQFLDNRILTVNTNSNLVLAPNGIGKVVSNVDILPNQANTLGLGSSNRRWNSIYTQFLDVSGNVNFNNLNISGNLSVDGNIIYRSNVFIGDLEGSVLDGASSMVLDVVSSSLYVDNYYYANGVPVAFGITSNVSNDLIPTANVTYSLGNATNQWADLWVSNSTIYMNSVPITVVGNTLKVAGSNVVTLATNGNLVAGNIVATGISTFTGPTTFTGNVNTVGPTIFIGNVTATGDTDLTGNITMTGPVLIVGEVINEGVSIFNGNITATGNSDFTGVTTFIGNTVFTGDQVITGSRTINGDSLFVGNVTANGVFTVNGPTILGNASLGGLIFTNQSVVGTAINGNISIAPEGSGTVVVPGLAMPTGVLTAENGDYNIDSVADADIRISAGTGTIVTGSNIVPSAHNTYSLGNDNFHYNSAFIGTGGIDIQNNVGNVNVSLKALNGNLIIGNASGLTVADFTFYNNAITIGNLAQDITIGTVGATGKIIFNRSIQVKDTTGTKNIFTVTSDGLTKIQTKGVIPVGESGLDIIGSSTGNTLSPGSGTGQMMHITGTDGTSTRATMDAFGGATNAFASWVGRAARGTVDSPIALQANDVIARISAIGWAEPGFNTTNTGGPPTSIDFVATDNLTHSDYGSKIAFYTSPQGAGNIARHLSATITSNSVTLPANSVLTFGDSTTQSTAFNPANVVTSLTVGTGLTSTGNATQGTVSINATGVQNVVGTSNQVIVSDSGGKNLTLSLPQNINTNSTVQFGNLTVGNLIVTGNTSASNVLVVNDKTLVLANNSTSSSQINGGGIILGNVLNGSYYRTFLYDLTNDRWDTDGAGLATLTLTAGNVYIETLWANNTGHFGGAFTGNTYPDAVIQADSDVNSYSQIVNQNHSNGTDASADLVAVNDIGTDNNNYIDMGINSSTYSNPAYSITVANDGYMFVNGGNLAVGTQSAGKNIVFHTGNTTSSALRATITDTGLSVVGNVSAAGFVASGNISAGNIIISGNLTVPFTSAILTTGTQPNITQVGTLVSLTSTGNVTGGNLVTGGVVSATGNVRGGNINTAGIVSAAGNITGGNVTTTAISATTISASGNITGGNLISSAGTFSADISATGNITGGNVNSVGVVSATGNIRGGNFNTAGLVAATGNVDGGNLRTGGVVVASGNIQTAAQLVSTVANGTAPFAINSTTKVTNLNADTVDGFDTAQGNTASTIVVRDSAANIAGANYNGTGVSVTGNVTASNLTGTVLTAAQPNITSVGTLTSLAVTGNISGGNVSGTTGTFTNVGGALTTAAQPNVTSVGTLTSLSVTGNVTGGNLLTSGIVSAASHIGSVVSVTGNVTGGNVNTAGQVVATANVSGGNINTAGQVVATGNATVGNLTTAGTVTTDNLVYMNGPFNNGNITTTLTLDFNNGSLQVVNLGASNPTFTLANAQAGKVIILIVRNTSGSNRTITHGVAAGNTTTGSATNVVNNGRIGMYHYVCTDNTTANVTLGFM